MSDTGPGDVDLQVVFSAASHRFAIPYHVVLQMVSPPPAVPVPNAHPAVRGVMNLRGDVLGLVCVRTLLGLPDIEAETAGLVADLELREREHCAWLTELRASVEEGRPFTLATDPHACAFGRWYDSFVPSSDHVRGLVKRLDEPHQRIHATATEVEELRRRGRGAEALEAVKRAEDTILSRLMRLLGEVREALQSWHRQIAVVVGGEGRAPLALLVDAVESVTALAAADDSGGEEDRHGVVAGLARDAAGDIVNRLDVGALYRLIRF